jgi:hypothetical protein
MELFEILLCFVLDFVVNFCLSLLDIFFTFPPAGPQTKGLVKSLDFPTQFGLKFFVCMFVFVRPSAALRDTPPNSSDGYRSKFKTGISVSVFVNFVHRYFGMGSVCRELQPITGFWYQY